MDAGLVGILFNTLELLYECVLCVDGLGVCVQEMPCRAAHKFVITKMFPRFGYFSFPNNFCSFQGFPYLFCVPMKAEKQQRKAFWTMNSIYMAPRTSSEYTQYKDIKDIVHKEDTSLTVICVRNSWVSLMRLVLSAHFVDSFKYALWIM